MKIKKILFISASRSDFYLQKILIDQMIKEKGFSLQLLVTGNHHLKEFGYSIKDVYKERYNFIKEIKIPNNIKKLKINYIFSYLTERISNQFIKNRPDVIILLASGIVPAANFECAGADPVGERIIILVPDGTRTIPRIRLTNSSPL